MKFVFVRHGHYDNKGLSKAEKQRQPLNDRGVEAARAAGRFLRDEVGFVPDCVVTTRSRRTRHTAELVLEEIGIENPTPRLKDGGFSRGRTSLEDKLDAWTRDLAPPPDTVMFVGHHSSLLYCEKEIPGTPLVKKGYKASVFVYERVEGGWKLDASFAGLGKA